MQLTTSAYIFAPFLRLFFLSLSGVGVEVFYSVMANIVIAYSRGHYEMDTVKNFEYI